MVALINILGFLSLCCILALRLERALVFTAPLATALWIFTLYILALCRALAVFDGLCLLLIALCAFLYIRRGAWCRLPELLFAPSAIAMYCVLLISFLLLKGILVWNRDDLGCWALEVKSITYFKGFAPKGQHAAMLYGSYYPGVSLMRWWTAHIAPAYFDGMMAVASAWLFVLILSPFFALLRCPRLLSPFFGVAIAGIFLLLPSVVDTMCYMNLCAELPMSAAFTLLLWSAFYTDEKLRRPSLAAAFFFLFFFKLPGLAFGLSLLLFFMVLGRRGYLILPACNSAAEQSLALAGIALPCLIPSMSWHIFCIIMGRTDYFTVSMPSAKSAGAGFAGFWATCGGPYLKSLAQAFFSYPLHVLPDGIIDLSALCIILLFLALCLAAVRLVPEMSRPLRIYAVYICIVAVLLFWGLYFVHCFVFREDAYFIPEYMCYTISRYGLPFLLGTLLFLIYVYMQRMLSSRFKPFTKLLLTGLCAGLIFAMSCPWTVYYRTVDYSSPNAAATAQSEEISALCADFLAGVQPNSPQRFVLVCDAEQSYDYEDQVRLQYLSAPSAVYTLSLTEEYLAKNSLRDTLTGLLSHYDAQQIFFLNMGQTVLEDTGIQNGIFYKPDELMKILP